MSSLLGWVSLSPRPPVTASPNQEVLCVLLVLSKCQLRVGLQGRPLLPNHFAHMLQKGTGNHSLQEVRGLQRAWGVWGMPKRGRWKDMIEVRLSLGLGGRTYPAWWWWGCWQHWALSAFERGLYAPHRSPLTGSETVVWFALGGMAIKEDMMALLREEATSLQNFTNYCVSMPHTTKMFNILHRMTHFQIMTDVQFSYFIYNK